MEEMNPRERIDAAIALQPVDRVPIIPLIGYFAARHKGMRLDMWHKDPEAGRKAIEDTWDDLGGWDAVGLGSGGSELGFLPVAPIPVKLPGYALPNDTIMQIDEREVMLPEDYDLIVQQGWMAAVMNIFPKIASPIPPQDLPARIDAFVQQGVKDMQAWEARGILNFIGTVGLPPVEIFSLSRSIQQFVFDLYRRPDKVLAAAEVVVDEQIKTGIGAMMGMQHALKWGARVLFVGGTRATLLSPKLFDKFAWPYIERMVLAYLGAGITPMLHFDSNWTPFLEYFKRLPPKQVILELDSATDIFKAKQVLGGHMCLMGDVPATLLKLGTPDEVSAYVRRLIDVVGEGGGFILSTGCDCPVDAQFENVKAMIDTGKSYYPHKRVF
jgi:uroporphyrinogen-III decarboxylase